MAKHTYAGLDFALEGGGSVSFRFRMYSGETTVNQWTGTEICFSEKIRAETMFVLVSEFQSMQLASLTLVTQLLQPLRMARTAVCQGFNI